MKDADTDEKKSPGRTVRCRVCRYDVPAALQNSDGSKTTATAGDVLKARGWWIASALLSLAVQNAPEPHLRACGRCCTGGAIESGAEACPGIPACATCAADMEGSA